MTYYTCTLVVQARNDILPMYDGSARLLPMYDGSATLLPMYIGSVSQEWHIAHVWW